MDITIELKKYGDNEFKGEKVLHRKEMEYVKELLKKGIELASEFDAVKTTKPPVYNSILVDGKRGTGKTSFLYSLKAELEEDEKGFKDVCMLDFFDPTLIEEKAHVFLTIISLIRSKVNDKFASFSKEDCFLSTKKCWRSTLENLAKGLPLTNEKSNVVPDYWDDASHILNKGLDDMESAFNLRKNFNMFLKKSLEILGKECFLLFVDDVDTNFDKSWPLLETIRKYLCTPYIMTVVSGDYDLFASAVRQKQWENFGKPLLINEYDAETTDKNSGQSANIGRKKYLTSVTELESQYLLKLFKPENRIRLRSLKEIVEEKDTVTIVDTGKRINEVYKGIFANLGYKNSYQRDVYLDFIKGCPIRTQLGFLKLALDKKETINASADYISLFSAELTRNNIDIHQLRSDNLLVVLMLKYLVFNKKLDEFYQLEPISENSDTNACIFALSMLFSEKTKNNPVLFLDYMLRIAYLRNILEEIGYRSDENKAKNIEGLIKHCGAFADEDFRQMMCYLTAYIEDIKGVVQSGIIRIPSLSAFNFGKAKKNMTTDSSVENFDMLKDYEKSMVCLPLSVNAPVKGSNSANTYSLFTLLGAIADIIREKDTGNSTRQILTRLSQLRTYPTPKSSVDRAVLSDANGTVTDIGIDDDTIVSKQEEPKENEWNEFETILDTWIDFLKKQSTSIPSYLVAKIVTRWFYGFSKIIEKNKGGSLASVMSLLVCQLINGACVEEYIEYKANDKNFLQNTDNVVTSEEILSEHLKKATEGNFFSGAEAFPLTKMLITCPFLLIYLKSNNDNDSVFSTVHAIVSDLLKDQQSQDIYLDNVFRGKVFDALDKVTLSSRQRDTGTSQKKTSAKPDQKK